MRFTKAVLVLLACATPAFATHRISTTERGTGIAGIYVEDEIVGRNIALATTAFPVLRGTTDPQKIANLETDIHTFLDAQMPASTLQRIRVHIFSLVPLKYALGVFSSSAAITADWWVER